MTIRDMYQKTDDVEYWEVCWRCIELKAAPSLPAEEYVKFVCDLPPLAHSCGIGRESVENKD